MTKTDKIVEDVTFHFNHLTAQHKTLHQLIERAPSWMPDEHLTNMKQKKLRIKDQMENFRHTLENITKIS